MHFAWAWHTASDALFFWFTICVTATLDWIRSLHWPMGDEQAPKGPLGFNRGISWIELAMSWMLYHNLYVPVVREDERKVKRLLQPASYFRCQGQWAHTIWIWHYDTKDYWQFGSAVTTEDAFSVCYHIRGLKSACARSSYSSSTSKSSSGGGGTAKA